MPVDGRCRSCRAPILWARSQTTDHLMPLDPQPVPAGNLAICGEPDTTAAPQVRVVPVAERGDHEHLYQVHFASCPFAQAHRRARARRRSA